VTTSKQWQFLTRSFAFGKVSHAYLFSGQSQLGKKQTAFDFAQYLHCSNPDFSVRPCHQCSSCREFEKNCHPDFLYLTVSQVSNKEEGEIGMIRDLRDWLSLKPSLSKFKVCVIDQVQEFSLPAQSALLKTLEDPLGQAVIILICNYPGLLMPTIISRTQTIKFYPASRSEIMELLTSKGATQESASRISFFCLGKSIKALELLDEGKLVLEQDKLSAFINDLKRNLACLFQEIEMISGDKSKELEEIERLMNFFRQVFLLKMKSGNLSLPEEKLLKKLNFISVLQLKNFLLSLERANKLLLTTNANERLILENSVLELL